VRPAIISRIEEVAAVLSSSKWRLRLPSHIDTVIIHRVDIRDMAAALGQIPGMIDIVTLARLSSEMPELGRKLAYPILILASGTIEQGLPLIYNSPHARRWNRRAIGVGVEGDFRREAPTEAQIDSLRWLLPRLCAAYCPTDLVDHEGKLLPCLLGHGEAPDSHDGTKAPGRNNHCPGAHLDMIALRAHRASDNTWRARSELGQAGIKFDA
jgi:N-acetylmuramoyl-L-alanine amidase